MYLHLFQCSFLSSLSPPQVREGVADSWQEEEVWRMELYLSAGIMALCLLSLLAIASLPSVADALNWREFTFVQVRPNAHRRLLSSKVAGKI